MYSTGVSASGGSGTITYTVASGTALSAVNLSLASNGSITGTPNATETGATVSIKATDTVTGNSVSANFTLTIYSAIVFTGTTLQNGLQGTAYTGSVAASGGSGSYNYVVTLGTAFSAVNLTLQPGGSITGTPNATESAATVSIKATDANTGNNVTSIFTLTVYPALSITTNATLPSGINGGSYTTVNLAATGGSASGYTYSVLSGTGLSAVGLQLSSGGAISLIGSTLTGSETNATVTIQVKDGSNDTASQAFTLTVYPTLSVVTTSVPNGSVGVSYNSGNPTATGGTGTYSSWALTSGASCVSGAGLTFNTSTGAITGGSPTAAACSIVLQVTDSLGHQASSSTIPLNIYAGLTITNATTLPSGINGGTYAVTLNAAGGSGSGYSFSITSGATTLSSVGLQLNSSTGAITTIGSTLTGTETSATFTVKLTDNASNTFSQTFTLTIYPTITFANAALPVGVNGDTYSGAVSASGGSGGFTYTVTSGTGLSAVGLQLNTNGTITPIATDITNTESNGSVTIQAKDSNNDTASATFTLTVNAALSITTTGSLPGANIGSTYSDTLAATGGAGSYTWSFVTGGSALNGIGITLNSSTGQLTTGSNDITGTPNTYNFTVKVQDTNGDSVTSGTLSLTTIYGAPTITTTNIASATDGTPYTQNFNATGGSGSYTWSITTGSSAISALGLGMTTSSNVGVLSGTPTSTTTGTGFTVKVTDTVSTLSTTAPYTMIVNSAAAPVCTYTGANNAILNGHYAFLLGGFDPNGNHFSEIGDFTANGSGAISSGNADANADQNNTKYSSGELNFTFTGTYAVGNSTSDTRGMLTLSNGSSTSTGLPATGSYCFAADTVVSGVAESGRLIETDGSGFVLSGYFEEQNNGDFSNSGIANSYAFGVSGVDGTTPNRVGAIGVFTINSSGALTAGQMDHSKFSSGSVTYVAADSFSTSATYSGSSMASSGRGTLKLGDGSSDNMSFITYLAGSNKLFLLASSNSSEPFQYGQAVQQTTTNFTTANAKGSGVFRSSGTDVSDLAYPVEEDQLGVGVFDGAGNFSGLYDSHTGPYVDYPNGTDNYGNIKPNIISGATYSVANSNGYLTLAGAGNNSPRFYLNAPGSGFGLNSDKNVSLFTLYPQTAPSGGVFTNSILNSTYLSGSYAIGNTPAQTYGIDGANSVAISNFPDVFDGAYTMDNGNMTGTYDTVGAPGTNSYVFVQQPATYTYELDPDYGPTYGRVLFDQAGALGSVGYVVSPTQTLMMQAVSGQSGLMSEADQISTTLPSNNNLQITSNLLSSGTVGTGYSFQLTATGGSGTYNNWTVKSGTGLSAVGLTLSSSGLISGTPNSTESLVAFTVQLTDSASNVTTATLYMTVVGSSNNGYNVSGNISMNNTCGNVNIPNMQVSISTSPVQTVTATNGSFNFSNIPNGTYTITPWISGAVSIFSPGNQSVTVSNSGASANFSVALGYTISGTVTYTSQSSAHQVYLGLENTNTSSCNSSTTYGTSFTAAASSTSGTYTIQGVPPGSYSVNAFMDSFGYGINNISDLSGAVITSVTSSNITAPSMTLYPGGGAQITSSAPQLQGVSPFNNGVLAQFGAITNTFNTELPTSYTLQWSTSSSFTTIAGSQTYPATGTGGANLWFANTTSATNGSTLASGTYYFRAYATAGAETSEYSSTVGPITMGSPSQTYTVTGTVQYTGITPNSGAPLYAGFYDTGTGVFYGEYFPTPGTGSQTYSIKVPAGTFYYVAVLDQAKVGAVVPGDLQDVNNSGTPQTVTISASGAQSTLVLNTSNAQSIVYTQFQYDMQNNSTTQYNSSYEVEPSVASAAKQVVGVTMVSAPTLLVPLDIAICSTAFTSNGNSCGEGFQFQLNTNGVTPNVGDVYDFNVTYSDGTSGLVTATVASVLGTSALVVPNASSISLTATSTHPSLNWTYPTNPSNYTYQFQFCCSNNGDIWQIPGQNTNSNGFTYTQITPPLTWGTDPTNGGNTPSPSLLTIGDGYNWQIQSTDSNGNAAIISVNY